MCAALSLLFAAETAGAIETVGTISAGQTVYLTRNADFPSITNDRIYQRLQMEGGTLRIGDVSAGNALTISATDAILGRGWVYHWYAQKQGTTFDFYGTTTVTGGPSATDTMTLSANMFDTQGWSVVNHGVLVQSGYGQFTLGGPTRFVNAPASTFYLDNDRGMVANASCCVFENDNAASLIKRSGTSQSDFNVYVVQHSGNIEVWSGTLALGQGGEHESSRFYAGGLAGTPAMLYFGGTHVLTGTTTTSTGNYWLGASSTIRVTNTPSQPDSEWHQFGNFEVLGTVDLAGTRLRNAGTMTVNGNARLLGFGSLRNTGSFMGNIASSGPGQSIQVANEGTFTIGPGQSAFVGDFVNSSGTLTVDGLLWNVGGSLQLTGGTLLGNGIINGDVFVGGGPGIAHFNPGHSPGAISIQGNFSLLKGGVLNLEVDYQFDNELGGLTLTYDGLPVTGSVTLDGRVNVIVGASVDPLLQSTPWVMQAVNFFPYGNAITYGPNFSWDFPGRPGSQLSAGASGLQILAVAPLAVPVPEPRAYQLLLAGLGCTIWVARFRGRRGASFHAVKVV